MNSVGSSQSRIVGHSLLVSIFIFFTFFIATPAHATTIQELQTLLAQLQTQLALLKNQTNESNSCVELSSNMAIGSTDVATGGQVGKLQQFLKSEGVYTYPTITGYYGAVTATAVSAWQAKDSYLKGIANVRFGSVDEATRAAMKKGCAGTSLVEVLTTTPTSPIDLPARTWGEYVLDFEIDAEDDLAIADVTVNLALPFVKAGSWEDMISQIAIVSEDSQRTIVAETIYDNDQIVSLLGDNHDEVTAHFTIPKNLQKFFTVKGGDDSTFRILIDFKPADKIGGFGVQKGVSEGYVRASLVEVLDTNLEVIPIWLSSYGPHRVIRSAYHPQ
jgi:hypothetical protein